MTDSAVLQPDLQQPPWQVDRFIVSTALAGFALLGGLIWLETAPFMVVLFVVGTVLGMALYHGAFGQQRSLQVRVDVVVVPIEIERPTSLEIHLDYVVLFFYYSQNLVYSKSILLHNLVV